MTARPPPLWFGIGTYLATLPFLPPQLAARALLALALWFAIAGLPRNPIVFADLWPLAPFLATSAFAAARATDPVLAAGFLSFQLPGLILFVLATTDRGIDTKGWMRLWTLFSLVIAASVLFGRLRLAFGAEPLFGEDVPQAALRLSGNTLLAVPNDLCVTAILAAFPLGLLALGARGIERGFAVLTLSATLLAVVLMRSRTGALITGVEAALAILAQPRLLRAILPLMLVALLVDLGFGHAGLQKLLLTDAHDLHGIAGRAGLWVSAWRMFLAAPALGHGALSFGPEHFAYLPDWAPRYPEGHAPWAHDLFLDILAEQGVLGAAAFACLVLPPLRACWRARSRLDAKIALWALAGFGIAACLELAFIRRVVPALMFGVLGFAVKAAHAQGPAGPGRTRPPQVTFSAVHRKP